MSSKEILARLEKMGSASIKKVYMNHGAVEPFFGVKVGDMKTIVKEVKQNHALAMELYASGNSDAMYLAGLISSPQEMSKKDLQLWVKNAKWYMHSEYTVAWTAAESAFARELAMEWIASANELTATAGWSTYASHIQITPNEKLDIKEISALVNQIEKGIAKAPNRVRYVMNGFLIMVGTQVQELHAQVLAAVKKIGKVEVEMGGTACAVPDAVSYIAKTVDKGGFGKKKKTAKC
ncbi:MAG: DNA alkylation repair protein [Flavobacteriales bacterium]|jgi:3-methyladenine DNA glycosylase AlkD